MSYHFMYACSFFYSTTLDHELLINFIFFLIYNLVVLKNEYQKTGQNYGRIRPGLMGRNYVDHFAG